MTYMTGVPDPNAIYALYTPGFKPQVVRVALLLDVFSPLARGPLGAEAVARARDCSPQGMLVLLDYLAALGLLRLEDSQYELTATAATVLVRGEPAYVGDWILAETDPRFWERVLAAVRAGERALARFPWAQDAWLESYRPDRREQSLAMWRAAGIESAGEDPLALLDLACGCGVKSMVLAQSRAGVQVTCVDRADVLEVARDLAARLGVSSRVLFEAADIHKADLLENAYDATLLGQITDYLTPTQNIRLFARVRSALKPCGVLVIDVPMSSDQPTEGASLVTLLTWALSGGRAHSFDNYQAWLTEAGLAQVERLGDTWIAARVGLDT
jgi:SAM-dependent methyltransferase